MLGLFGVAEQRTTVSLSKGYRAMDFRQFIKGQDRPHPILPIQPMTSPTLLKATGGLSALACAWQTHAESVPNVYRDDCDPPMAHATLAMICSATG